MGTFYKDLQEKIGNQIIDIRDFRTYHVHRVGPKDTADVIAIKKLCDQEYEKFHTELLVPHADEKGKILCELASDLWIYYEDIREVESFIKNLKVLPKPDMNVVEFWLEEFKKPSDELHIKYGTNTIATAYGAIIEYTKHWTITTKYERIYSQAKSIDHAIELLRQNRNLLDGSALPVNLNALGEKIRPLMTLRA